MDLPADQQLLFRDLSEKIDRQEGEEPLARVAGEVLRSLLRRQGDAEFRTAIQDALTEGLAGRTLAEQKTLCRQVVVLVIQKRPEVALAWQALHGKAVEPPPLRRAADVLPPPPPEPEVPAPPVRPPWEFAAAEAAVAAHLTAVLRRRLEVFALPPQGFPTAAYRHEQPFFLFAPEFVELAANLLTGPLLTMCRDPLERRLYRGMTAAVMADSERLAGFLAGKRSDLTVVLGERLTKLATFHRAAEDKLAAARRDDAGGPGIKEVEVPVTRPRVIRVLGVAFTLGQQTEMRRKRIKLPSANQIEPEEMEALELIAAWRDESAHAGIDLPSACDFQFLRTLLEFEAGRFKQAVEDLTQLAAQGSTSRLYLLERVGDIDRSWPNTLADVMVLMLFARLADGGFGFRALYDVCMGSALDAGAQGRMRPFIQREVARRPRDLAFQLREALRRRADVKTVEAATRLLVEAWQVMAPARFQHELEAGLTVLAAFPMVFSGEPDEAPLCQVGHLLYEALAKNAKDAEMIVSHVLRVYAPVVARRGGK
ncbi:MAG: hypothetical protein HY985_15220 [Magnetospirillum sp.]|nr:hypothetical protein [Magnetospirillum sp.]